MGEFSIVCVDFPILVGKSPILVEITSVLGRELLYLVLLIGPECAWNSKLGVKYVSMPSILAFVCRILLIWAHNLGFECVNHVESCL